MLAIENTKGKKALAPKYPAEIGIIPSTDYAHILQAMCDLQPPFSSLHLQVSLEFSCRFPNDLVRMQLIIK